MTSRTLVDPGLVGLELGPVAHDWTARDAVLYSLGIGARLPDDLEFVYEGANAHGPRVEPTFALTAVTRMLPPLVEALGIDLRTLLHASQTIEVERILKPSGSCTVTRRVTGVWDKGRAAIIDCEELVADGDGLLATARSSWWMAGAGGFGGPRGPTDAPAVPVAPERPPDARLALATTREQAALYRLSGDLNPVHIDPEFARAAGQPREFLHGLCTLGMLAHALSRAAGADLRLVSIDGRFAGPVFPGEELAVQVWWQDGDALARVDGPRGPVLAPAVARFA